DLSYQFIVGRGSAHELRLDPEAPCEAVGHGNLDAGRLTVASGNQQRGNVFGDQPDAEHAALLHLADIGKVRKRRRGRRRQYRQYKHCAHHPYPPRSRIHADFSAFAVMTVSAAVPSTVSSETSGATAGCVVASTTTASASGICAFNRIGARIGTSAGPPPTAA